MLATHVSNHDRLVIHVEPCHDLIEHAEGFACVCGPRVQVCGDGWLVTHHSLDGRERAEA
jgi:hypothetical protein